MNKFNHDNIIAPVPPARPNGGKLLLSEILHRMANLETSTRAQLLAQDADIDTLYNNLKTELANSIAETVDTMQQSGELAEIITDSILEDINAIRWEINNDVLFYGKEIYTQHLYDSTSDTDYYITHVPPFNKNGDPLRLRLGIADDNINCNSLESTLHFAQRKEATLAINAGFFNTKAYTPLGGLIMDGEIIREGVPASNINYICIDKYGNLCSRPFNYSLKLMLREGIVQATNGRTILIENNVTNTDLPNNDRHPRQAIAQKTTGEILILTCDGRDLDNNGMTYGDLQRIFNDLGAINAYELDGGGSSATILREIKQNDNIDQYGSIDREVSNFFYITKPTVPAENQIISDAYEEIGKVKHELIRRIVNGNIIEKGFIRLACKKGMLQPGIEAYLDGSTTRYGKMGWNGEKGYWYANMITEDGTLENVVRADHESLWGPLGQLANFFAYPKNPPKNSDDRNDLNVTGVPSTIFYQVENNTDNNPGIGNCLILHLPFTSNLNVNIRQIAIPLAYNQPFKIRGCSASGVWNDWKAFTGNNLLSETEETEGE